MNKINSISYSDLYIKSILQTSTNIAMVGLSSDWNRPSYFVAKYLIDRGYKIFPVNPKEKGKRILNCKVYKSLTEIKEKIDMIDIFRNSREALKVTLDSIKMRPKCVWMQIGVVNFQAEKIAKKNNIKVVMNRCPKIEFCRLSGELGWAGINSGTISNKRKIIRPIY